MLNAVKKLFFSVIKRERITQPYIKINTKNVNKCIIV